MPCPLFLRSPFCVVRHAAIRVLFFFSFPFFFSSFFFFLSRCFELGRYQRAVHWYTQLEKLAERGSLEQAAVLYRVGLALLLAGKSASAPLLHSQRILGALGLAQSRQAGWVSLALARAHYRENKPLAAAAVFAEAEARGVEFNAESRACYERVMEETRK